MLTVPAIWSNVAKQATREAAFRAGITLKPDSDALTLCFEPEAAAMMAVQQLIDSGSADGDHLIILDCGGGTVDITQLKVVQPKLLAMNAAPPPAQAGRSSTRDRLPAGAVPCMIPPTAAEGSGSPKHHLGGPALSFEHAAAPDGGAWGSSYVDNEMFNAIASIVGRPQFQSLWHPDRRRLDAATCEYLLHTKTELIGQIVSFKEGVRFAQTRPIQLSGSILVQCSADVSTHDTFRVQDLLPAQAQALDSMNSAAALSIKLQEFFHVAMEVDESMSKAQAAVSVTQGVAEYNARMAAAGFGGPHVEQLCVVPFFLSGSTAP